MDREKYLRDRGMSTIGRVGESWSQDERLGANLPLEAEDICEAFFGEFEGK